jgi:DNA-binding transcriptional regulator YiaG
MPSLSPAAILARKCQRESLPTRPSLKPTPLRIARESLNLALDAVARELGMRTAKLQRLELGQEPRLSEARMLAKFYGVAVDVLWPK